MKKREQKGITGRTGMKEREKKWTHDPTLMFGTCTGSRIWKDKKKKIKLCHLVWNCFSSIVVPVVLRCFVLTQSAQQHKRRYPVSLGFHVGATCWILCEYEQLHFISPQRGRWTVEGSDWLTEILRPFYCYLWDQTAHTSLTITSLTGQQ